MTVHGWRWGCGVSDDTGGVIPPTSASNLQHEKDTLVTPYLPPTILYPHPSFCPTLLPLSLSFEPKSNSVSGYEKVSTTTCNQTYERGSIYSFLVLSSMPPLVRNFTQYELYVFKGLLSPPPPFFVKEWLNSKTVADNSHFFQSRSSQHVSFLEEKVAHWWQQNQKCWQFLKTAPISITSFQVPERVDTRGKQGSAWDRGEFGYTYSMRGLSRGWRLPHQRKVFIQE